MIDIWENIGRNGLQFGEDYFEVDAIHFNQ